MNDRIMDFHGIYAWFSMVIRGHIFYSLADSAITILSLFVTVVAVVSIFFTVLALITDREDLGLKLHILSWSVIGILFSCSMYGFTENAFIPKSVLSAIAQGQTLDMISDEENTCLLQNQRPLNKAARELQKADKMYAWRIHMLGTTRIGSNYVSFFEVPSAAGVQNLNPNLGIAPEKLTVWSINTNVLFSSNCLGNRFAKIQQDYKASVDGQDEAVYLENLSKQKGSKQ